MRRSLPPLIALRAFESAARHRSFALAGDEMNLTPGAISHQVKQLEEWMGRPMFVRHPNGVTLTEAGKAFAARLGALFNQIAEAAAQAKSPDARLQVILRCNISIAAKCLIEPAVAFAKTYPEIELVIRSEFYNHDPFVGGADLAIFYSRGPLSGVIQEPLMQGAYRVVAAPAIVTSAAECPEPAEFLHLPLIHVKPMDRVWAHPDWLVWFEKAGVAVTEPLRGLTFTMFHAGIDACIAGAGFALVDDVFARTALERGELVQCSPLVFPGPHVHHLMVREAVLARPEVRLVRDWLVDWARAQGGATGAKTPE